MGPEGYDLSKLFGGFVSLTPAPKPVNVIFNDPATIVFWSDGTKTVVKAHNEPFNPEKGLAMAIVKKHVPRAEFNRLMREATLQR